MGSHEYQDPVSMTPSSTDGCVLSVCFRCRSADWQGGPDDPRPGSELADALELEAVRRGIDLAVLRDVRCMSQCKRPCVVAFSSLEKFTYLFGDLDPSRDAGAVLDAFMVYAARSDGFMERFDRPEVMRDGILGRIPPLVTGARQVEPRPTRRDTSQREDPSLTLSPLAIPA